MNPVQMLEVGLIIGVACICHHAGLWGKSLGKSRCEQVEFLTTLCLVGGMINEMDATINVDPRTMLFCRCHMPMRICLFRPLFASNLALRRPNLYSRSSYRLNFTKSVFLKI